MLNLFLQSSKVTGSNPSMCITLLKSTGLKGILHLNSYVNLNARSKYFNIPYKTLNIINIAQT